MVEPGDWVTVTDGADWTASMQMPYLDVWASEDDYIWYNTGQRGISAVTDANGRFIYTLDARLGEFQHYGYWWNSSVRQSIWGIEVTADDGSRQTVSSFAMVKVYDAAEVVRLDTGGYYKRSGVPFTAQVSATSISGEPSAGHRLTLQLRRYNSRSGNYTTVLQTFSLTTDARGLAAPPTPLTHLMQRSLCAGLTR